MKRVFLIDAMSHIYRAFFAPMGMRQEPLRSSKGQVTQAVFVFTNMLRKLLNDERPEYIAAIFDTDEPTFRDTLFAEYKANRQAMPDDLASQIPLILRVCEAFCIPSLSSDGYEADDVIGTLAVEIAEKGMQAVIVSNDKDLCQLVRDPHIVAMRHNAMNAKRKVPVPPIEWCDEAWVLNKFGVPPSKVIDLLGLMGDSVDNIPGAPGIGAKGALKLVQDFGSAEEAMKRADEVTHKTYRETLQNNQDIIRQSLELATIHTSVPVKLDLKAFEKCEPDRKLAYELFRELEFTALTREFGDVQGLFDERPATTAAGVSIETKYSVITTRGDLDKLVRRLFEADSWSFHVNDSKSNQKLSCYDKLEAQGMAIGLGNGESFYIDLENFTKGEDAVTPLRDLLTNGFLDKSAHDSKRNLGSLLKMGIEPEAVKDDVLIAAYLLDPTRNGYPIENLTQVFLGGDLARNAPEGFTDEVFRTAEAADMIARMTPILRERLRDNELEKVYDEIELPLVPILAEIELTGMKVDGDKLKKFSEYISKELDSLREKIFGIAGREFNIGSPQKLGEIFEELNFEVSRRTTTGKIATGRD
ncbi:MAG TPA: 5'-3' exonuclease H3TH domain-containing protein, partial [Pyrinomonadaceae bacterium]|nr:5'-3' exonuclease H3TH domain-containing protein [Pyrinomonadaceae bacterium]